MATLDPNIDRPEEREFDCNLLKYIPLHRLEIIKCCITILKAYHNHGLPKPPGIKAFGRFDEWDTWIRGCVMWLGLADPCETRKKIEESDDERVRLINLLKTWYMLFHNDKKTLKEVLLFASQEVYGEAIVTIEYKAWMVDFFEEVGEHSILKMGKYMQKICGRPESGLKLERAGTRGGANLWRVDTI